jgi:peroxiredoxin Q/BCP
MRTRTRSAVFALACALAASASAVEPGQPAPPFSLPGSDGRTHSLEEQIGRQAVVLAWFPKAFTPG